MLNSLRVPHSEMVFKFELIIFEDLAKRDSERALEESWLWKQDLCRVESSAKK